MALSQKRIAESAEGVVSRRSVPSFWVTPTQFLEGRMQVEVVKLGLAGLKEPSLVPAGNVVMNV